MDEQRRRVLVIDDEVKFGSLVARALVPEHEVVVLASAKEALDHIARGERFDLVLCDLMLPGVSGVDFHERVGSMAPELAERIVFVTGGAYSQRAVAFLERADIRHLEKPFPSLAGFRAVVQEHLQRVGGDGDRVSTSVDERGRSSITETERLMGADPPLLSTTCALAVMPLAS
jgi:DNA-binding NtrC family response regulator